MHRSIKEHIERIKDTISQLESDQPLLKDPMESLKTETDLRSLRLALMHYELALQIEHEVIEGRSARGARGTKSASRAGFLTSSASVCDRAHHRKELNVNGGQAAADFYCYVRSGAVARGLKFTPWRAILASNLLSRTTT